MKIEARKGKTVQANIKDIGMLIIAGLAASVIGYGFGVGVSQLILENHGLG